MNRIIGIAVVVVVAIGTAVWMLRSPQMEPESAEVVKSAQRESVGTLPPAVPTATPTVLVVVKPDERLRFAPRDKESITFRLDLSSQAQVNFALLTTDNLKGKAAGSASNTPLRIASSGYLTLKYYLRPDGQKFDVAAVLEELRYTINDMRPEYAQALTYPFVFQMTPTGYLSDFKFTRGVSEMAQLVIKNILYGMQIGLPDEPKASWQTRELDAAGQYRAEYRIPQDAQTGAALALEKRKIEYLKVNAAESGLNIALSYSHVRVENNLTSAAVSFPAAWIATLEQNETTTMLAGGGELGRTTTTFKANRVSRTPASFSDRFDDVMASLDASELLRAKYVATDPVLDRMGANLNLNQALEHFSKLRKSTDSNERRLAEKFLVNYLRQFPQASAELIRMLDADPKREEFDHESQLVLWRLIAAAGHPTAQQAVIDAIRGEQFSDLTHVRAMAYVHDLEYPEPFVAESLWDVYRESDPDSGNAVEKDLHPMALYALGALGSAEKLNEALKPEIRTRLVENLREAPDTEAQVLGLAAIANYGGPDVIDDVEPYFSESDEQVRMAAFAALRRMDDSRAVETLAGFYAEETSDAVKLVALKTLADMPPSKESVEFAQKEVLNASAGEGQEALVQVLGRSLKEHPESQQALLALLAAQPSNRVKKTIYQYIQP